MSVCLPRKSHTTTSNLWHSFICSFAILVPKLSFPCISLCGSMSQIPLVCKCSHVCTNAWVHVYGSEQGCRGQRPVSVGCLPPYSLRQSLSSRLYLWRLGLWACGTFVWLLRIELQFSSLESKHFTE